MAYNLEEQEQIAQLKAFWDKWGLAITAVLSVGVLTYAGWQGYGWYQKRQVVKAEAAFEQFNVAIQKPQGQQGDLNAQLTQLQNSFGRTNYASLASLQMSAVLATEGQYEPAQAPLQWVIKNGEPENQGVARLRLADLQMQLNQKDAALQTLSTSVEKFEAAFAAKKSDIYMVSGELDQAKTALNEALAEAKKASPANMLAVDALESKLKLLPQ